MKTLTPEQQAALAIIRQTSRQFAQQAKLNALQDGEVSSRALKATYNRAYNNAYNKLLRANKLYQIVKPSTPTDREVDPQVEIEKLKARMKANVQQTQTY